MNRFWSRALVVSAVLLVTIAAPIVAMQGNQAGLAVEPDIFGGDSSINVFIHLNEEWAIKPGVFYTFARESGDTIGSAFGLNLAVDYYLSADSQASPYFGVDVGLFERLNGGAADEATNSVLTYIAPRGGAQVMLTDLVGFYAHAGLRIDIENLDEDGFRFDVETFTTGLGVVLYVY